MERARPYAEDFHRSIYAPSLSFGKQSYETYGAPRVGQLREYGEDRWEKSLRPKIEAVQAQAKKQYDSTLAPQVSKVSAATLPYYVASRENILQIYDTRIMSAYTTYRPYADKNYAYGHRISNEIGHP